MDASPVHAPVENIVDPVAEDHDMSEPAAKRAKYEEEGEAEVSRTLNVFSRGCGVCSSASSKYRCPGCEFITCSLACTKEHRAQSGCKGTRDRTAFVPISRFNEQHLLSDINLLNDFARATESSKKTVCIDEEERLSKRFKLLQGKARQFGLKLHFLPSVMSKHRQNTTRFDQRTQRLLWHAEVHFALLPESGKHDLKGIDDSAPFSDSLHCVLGEQAHASLKEKVMNVYPADLSRWRYYLLQTMCPANKPLFHAFSATEPMRNTLLKTDILEYPTIYISIDSEEAKYELFSENAFAQRSKSHLDFVETLAPTDPQSGEEESSSSDSSSNSDSDSDDSSSSDDSSDSEQEKPSEKDEGEATESHS